MLNSLICVQETLAKARGSDLSTYLQTVLHALASVSALKKMQFQASLPKGHNRKIIKKISCKRRRTIIVP